MSALEAVFFGIVQGLAEFLPISSSGHLAFFHNLFENLTDLESESAFVFDILLHLGTLLAVCIVYYKDIWELILSFFSLIKKVFTTKLKEIKFSSGEKFLLMLIVAVIPLILGAVLEGTVEFVRNYTLFIGVLWIINGGLLFFADRLSAKKVHLEKNKNLPNALKVGLCQVLAIFPGISRSGMTITGGLLCGFDREFAVKFSFILSIPAILGANILSIPDILGSTVSVSDILPFVLGVVAATFSGLAAIKILNYISRKNNFRIFSVYSVAIGILAIVLALFKIG